MTGEFRFSFGPWNIHEGADPFGPEVRRSIDFNAKLGAYKELGFDGVQFHDDDAVPNLNDLTPEQVVREAAEVRKVLDGHGLTAEFVAPRLWFDPRTIDGGYTSNCPKCREYALDRTKRTIDIANALGTRNIAHGWREGTYIREAKDPAGPLKIAALQMILDYPECPRMIESKPNEPMDHTHSDHRPRDRDGVVDQRSVPVGCLIETAHALLANLSPSDEMGFAMAHRKLWSVHLNDRTA